jgi:hypothetical protein
MISLETAKGGDDLTPPVSSPSIAQLPKPSTEVMLLPEVGTAAKTMQSPYAPQPNKSSRMNPMLARLIIAVVLFLIMIFFWYITGLQYLSSKIIPDKYMYMLFAYLAVSGGIVYYLGYRYILHPEEITTFDRIVLFWKIM